MSLLCLCFLVFVVAPPIVLYLVFKADERLLDKQDNSVYQAIIESEPEIEIFLLSNEPNTKIFEDFVNDLDMDGL